MAGILTSQKATQMVGNCYDMILIAARRARELSSGHWDPLVDVKGAKPVSVALAEIEQGKIGREYLAKPQNLTDAELREQRHGRERKAKNRY